MGTIDERVLVIDDFYDDPDKVRNTALTQYNGELTGRSKKPYFPKGVVASLESQLGRKITVWETEEGNYGVNGYFWRTFSQGDSKRVQCVHYDEPLSLFQACVYLSPDVSPKFGTSFWMHKETGFCSIDDAGTDDSLKDSIDLDLQEFSFDKWINIFDVPYQFNRALIFPAGVFHSAKMFVPEYNGQDRLVQLLHFGLANN